MKRTIYISLAVMLLLCICARNAAFAQEPQRRPAETFTIPLQTPIPIEAQAPAQAEDQRNLTIQHFPVKPAYVLETPPPPAGPDSGTLDGRRPVRAFVTPNSHEHSGYARYSYLLLGQKPTPETLPLYKNIIGSFLALEEMSHAALGGDPERMNATYLMLTEPPPKILTPGWVLKHYDYQREAEWLKRTGDTGNGPIVVTGTSPLLPVKQVDVSQLDFQRLTGEPEELAFFLRFGPIRAMAMTFPSARLTGREFFPDGETEEEGYGLYSYLLFVDAVNPGNRALYHSLLDAYLQEPEIDTLKKVLGMDPAELNILYLPVGEKPPENPDVEWLMVHYSLARARIIARSVPGANGSGPYLVSYLTPLSRADTVDPERMLVQDLSGVPDTLAFLWLNEFIDQVREPRFWDPPTLRNLMLGLRTKMSVMAHAFSEVWAAYSSGKDFIESKIRMTQ